MPSVAQAIDLGHIIIARCPRCTRSRPLDLAALAPVHGSTELARLPLRCTGIVAEPEGPGVYPCDGQRFTFTVVVPVALRR